MAAGSRAADDAVTPAAARPVDGPLVPDLATVEVPVGGRVLIVSDLQLEREATAASTSAAVELALVVEAWSGPGLLVFNGDLFEMLDTPVVDPKQALASHPRLSGAVSAFAQGEGRRVLVLPGSRDSRLAWDERMGRTVMSALGAGLALAAELRIATGRGKKVVHVEPGHRFDARSAFRDPRNPADTPLGHHVVREILPTLGAARHTWLSGVARLRDGTDLPRFIASRLAYRRLARYGPWLLAPFVLALILKLPLAFSFVRRRGAMGLDPLPRRLLVIGLTTTLDLVLVVIAIYLVSRRVWSALAGVTLGERGLAQNGRARDEARTLVTSGSTGLVTAHTHRPELTHLGRGFYANCGCATEVVDEVDARFGLPSVFLPHRELSWVELEAGADLHVRLLRGGLDLPGGSLVERLLAKTSIGVDSRPTVVATFPQGESWPPVTDPGPALRRVRRRAATAIALAGVLDLASALSPPQVHRLGLLVRLVPLAVPQAATALVAFAGLILLLLARGVRRGQRQAWLAAVALLTGSAVLHVAKGIDLEEALAAGLVAGYLLVHRRQFAAAVDRPSVRRGILTLLGGGVASVTLGTLAIETFPGRRPRLTPVRAVAAAAQRMAGTNTIAVGHRVDTFTSPALLAIGVGLLASFLWLAFRPVVTRRKAQTGDDLTRARDVVRRHGAGTLDYFALRSDKEWFFFGDSLVAYAVYSGVCLVSPDPIGPEAVRDQAWDAFRAFADEHGWAVAVMGAGESWLPTYREAGMHDLYVGDEAVADVRRFTLDGGRNKGLRQAVNRIAKYGYTISFHDPCALEAPLRQQLAEVMTKSRRGDVERGFSMTLGRIFDPADTGLLLAVAWGPEGAPVAFCQYVPAPGIDGFSLDLMRRDDGEHPNGLLDFVIVETIRHLKEQGARGLGLNFATMRAVLAGEAGDSLAQRVEAWVLRRMSDSMQIESLWRFNAKYDPDWQPRYAVYDSPEHLLPAAMAVARAESFWELPLIGRFLVPKADPVAVRAPDQPPAPSAPPTSSAPAATEDQASA